MAIIKCPECGHQVSEKAPVCPGCGVEIAGKIVKCPDCGEVYFADQTLCPACHRPTETMQGRMVAEPAMVAGNASKVETKAGEGVKKQKKSYTTLVVCFVAVLALCGAFAYFYNDKVKQNEENKFYERAMLSSNPLELQEYLNQYRGINPEHTDSINAHLSRLMQMDTDWSNAVVSGTREAIEEYMRQHPDSPHKSEAMNKIDSIDFIVARKNNSLEAYQEYLEKHPDGKYADEAKNELDGIKMKEVQPEEVQLVRGLFKRFFQSVNSRNEDGMLATVAENLTSFLGKSGAGKGDVVTFLQKIYKADIKNMNWHILDDFNVDKKDLGNGECEYSVKFSAEQNIERTDASQPRHNKYVISAVVNPDGKISQFNMVKTE